MADKEGQEVPTQGMADKEEGQEVPTQGIDWEVVSLTASAYAASPNPEQVKLNDDDQGHRVGQDKGDTPDAMFLSRHFGIPPTQHEDLPLVTEKIEIFCEEAEQVDEIASDFVVEEGGISNTKDGENLEDKALSMSDEFVDEKGKSLSVSGTEFEEGMALHKLTLVDEEQAIIDAAKYTSICSEATICGSTPVEYRTYAVPVDPSEEGLDSNISPSPKLIDEDEVDSSDLPSEAWWKKRAVSLYARAKETNAVWSIFIAAAVMGIVIIGQKWQQERWQVLQRKWHYGDEKMGKMMGPLSRVKQVIVGGQRSGSAIRGSTTSQR